MCATTGHSAGRIHLRLCSTIPRTVPPLIRTVTWPDMEASCRPMPMVGWDSMPPLDDWGQSLRHYVSAEVRERAACLALDLEGQHESRWQTIRSIKAKTGRSAQMPSERVKKTAGCCLLTARNHFAYRYRS
jgi:hypothetical protein